jgi:tetratricopeptide (TPR) repeat protein
MDTTKSLPNFDKLWDYQDPAATETKFRELLPLAESADDETYVLELKTQIARTLGLQGKFDESHALLDTIEKRLTPDTKLARVRYLLERGRAMNSSGNPEDSRPLFEEAYVLADEIHEARLAIDAVHMIAIVEPDPHKQIEWNLKGIEQVESDASQMGWLHALYNNIGESYSAIQDYSNALVYFNMLLELQKERGEPDIYTIKDVARVSRLSGDPTASLKLMQPVFDELSSQNKDDGWIREELAEAFLALGQTESANPHFVKAYELLSKEPWYKQNQASQLERLKRMAEA